MTGPDRPVITTRSIVVQGADSLLTDVEIRGQAGTILLNVRSGRADRVLSVAPGGVACRTASQAMVGAGLITNSVCAGTPSQALAVDAGTARNVTARGDVGIHLLGTGPVVNSIADAGGVDVSCAGGGTTPILTNDYFADHDSLNCNLGATTERVQTGLLFRGAPTDLRQQATSTTIDAGTPANST